MPATNQSLGATASSRSVSRLRRQGNHAAADTNTRSSSRTSSTGDDSAEPADMIHRSSMDAAIDKVRERARKSVDERRGSDDSASANRFSNLITRKLKRKDKDKDRDSLGARNSTLAVDSGESGELALSDARSDGGSLLDEDGHSSLLTDDGSDNDGKPIRPTISPHQSHSAFLTLSSPQLQAQSAQRQPAPDLPETFADDQSQVLSFNGSTSSLPQIIEPPNNTSPISKGASKRNRNASPSPGDKLRAGFARNRRKSTESARSGVGGESGVLGGIGGLFKPRSRRSSVTSPDPVTTEHQVSPLVQANPDEPVSVDHLVAETVAAPETPQSAAVQPTILAGEEQTQTPKSAPRRGRINTATSLPETPPGGRPETPTTLVTPPTPTDPSTSTFPRFSIPGAKQPSAKPLSSVDSIRHRRAQSQTIPSKLSNAVHAPLTPTIEETKTPGGTLTQPTTATGFFSSVFNVAQKAADQLSTTINTGQKNKAIGAGVKATEGSGEQVISGTETTDNGTDTSRQHKGNSSVTSFGVAENRNNPSMNPQTDLPRQQDESNGSVQTSKMEEDAAARAVSVAYEKPVVSAVSQAMGARPVSVASQDRLTLNGDQTPPRSAADADGLKRSSSVRSKISGRRRRHRENSTATTNTNATAVNSIAAALKDSASGFSSVANTGPGHRVTGFAVASSKRNKDFHQLFRSVPEDDYLIEDYSAALQKEILLHGRLYVSEGHICFSSNIFGWVTNLVISFDEVVSVEKKNTAVVFPNAIVIQTLHARNTFASFVARDSTYELLIGIWKINHPKLKSSLNGIALDNVGESDKTEKAGSIASDDDSDDGSEDEVYDEDDDDDDFGSYTEPDAGRSIAGSDVGEPMLSRKTSAQPLAGAAQLSGNVSRTLDAAEAAAVGAPPGGDFPGPHVHAPTECTDTAEHYDRPLTDSTIPAPLGKVYSLMFGSASGSFMKKWLVDEQKSRELDLNDDKIGLDNDHKSFTFSYIKPLNAPVGPKQTKCITTNTLEAFDLEKAITVNCSTQTPDVPSGSVFTTKTKYCLMWGPGNSTRIIANCTIEWTGKSWLKGPIESGAQGGQTQYVKDITAALTAAVSTKAAAKGGAAGRKGKKKGKKEAADSSDASEQRVTAVAVKEHNWGLFEPLRGPLDPFASLLGPFFTSQVVIAVLFTLLVYSWFFASRSPGPGPGGVAFGGSGGERAVAYEELWRREESELWDWLEDRVGLDGLYAPKIDDRQKVLSAREMGRRLESEGMRGREVDDAIRITEERLGALKAAVEREKGNGKGAK